MEPRKIVKLYKAAPRITKWSEDVAHLCQRWMNEPDESRLLIFDTETTGVDFNASTILHHKSMDIHCPRPVVFGMSYCLEIKGYPHLFWARMESKLFNEMLTLLNYQSIKAAHNARYDIRMCGLEGFKIAGLVDCTYTMARIIYDRHMKHSLQSLSEMWCPELSDWEEPVKHEWTRLKNKYTRAGYPKDYTNHSFIPNELEEPYSMTDSFMCWIGYKILKPQIDDVCPDVYERERKTYYVINRVESIGMAFDYRKAEQLADPLREDMKAACETMYDLAGGEFKQNYPKAVIDTLLQVGIPEKDLMLKGQRTSRADVIKRAAKKCKSQRAKKFVDALLAYRAPFKVVNTYLDPLAERARNNNGIVHTEVNPADTITSRMASRNPNLQNIPDVQTRYSHYENPVRACFVPRQDCDIYYFDYEQMEMAVFGLYAGEERILEGYANGEDIHDTMADYLFGKKHSKHERDITKNVSFGIIYGLGENTMALKYEMSVSDVRRHRRVYFKEFPSIQTFQDRCKDALEECGYVRDFFGRRYHVPVVDAYKAVNCLVQGSCAQGFKIGVLQSDSFIQACNWPSYIILLVHDEIQAESKRLTRKRERYFCEHIIDCMTNIPQFLDRGLRLRVDVEKTSTNWSEKKKVKL